MDAVIIIPTIDPDSRLVTLVDDMRDRGFTRFIVVDDGSKDESRPLFEALRQRGVHVFYHVVNLGKGQAIKTALMHVRKLFPDTTHVVTMDDDGQHLPDDVASVCELAAERPDHLVLGVRDLRSEHVPARSRIGNAFSSAYFKLDTGVSCPDTQTGLRAIPASLLSLALSTPGTRYDYEMNFLTACAKQGTPLAMAPIATVYENNNAGSHFSPVRDSVLIYRQFFRFAGSSAACACLDLGLFALITTLISLDTALLVAMATFVARIASGALNFTMNRTWSFSQSGSMNGDAKRQAIRYAVLFCGQMLASMALVTALSPIPLPLVGIKVIVDGALFVASYFIQRNWVFATSSNTQALIVKGGTRANAKPNATLTTL